MRFIHLGADPPETISISMGYMSDPGPYVHNARNKVLFGKWEIDNWNLMYITPIPHYLTYLIFLVFGVGITQMNLLPALFSCFVLLFTYLICKKNFDSNFAFIGTFLLGINYIFTMFSQVAVRVMPMLFFVVLTLYFLSIKNNIKKINLFLAGAMCFFAFTVKGTFLQILPAIILGLLFYYFFQFREKPRKIIQDIVLFFSGIASVLIIWLLTIYLPHKDAFLPYGHSNFKWLTPHSFPELLKNFWNRPLFFFMNMEIVTLLSSLCLLSIAYKVFINPKKITLVTWVCGFWVLSNTVYFSSIYYRPTRHFIPVILPIIILATTHLYNFFKIKKLQRPQKKPILFFFFLFFWCIYSFSSMIILIGRPNSLSLMLRYLFFSAGLSLFATIAVYILFLIWPKNFFLSLSLKLKTYIILLLILISAVLNILPYIDWAANVRYDRKNISKDLGKIFTFINIGGLVSPVLSLENKHKAHPYATDYINRGLDFIDRYNITHVLLTTHAEEITNYKRDFPEYMKKAKLIARYPLWQTYVNFYDLIPPDTTPQKGKDVYEGETFIGKKGIPRFDSKASGKLAFIAEKSQDGFLITRSTRNYSKGDYQVHFRLKTEGILPENIRVARIDIIQKEQRKVLARKDIYMSDITSSGIYQNFTLPISLRKNRLLTLRVYSAGRTQLSIDKAIIEQN